MLACRPPLGCVSGHVGSHLTGRTLPTCHFISRATLLCLDTPFVNAHSFTVTIFPSSKEPGEAYTSTVRCSMGKYSALFVPVVTTTMPIYMETDHTTAFHPHAKHMLQRKRTRCVALPRYRAPTRQSSSTSCCVHMARIGVSRVALEGSRSEHARRTLVHSIVRGSATRYRFANESQSAHCQRERAVTAIRFTPPPAPGKNHASSAICGACMMHSESGYIANSGLWTGYTTGRVQGVWVAFWRAG